MQFKMLKKYCNISEPVQQLGDTTAMANTVQEQHGIAHSVC
jgi:hypothetical protein